MLRVVGAPAGDPMHMMIEINRILKPRSSRAHDSEHCINARVAGSARLPSALFPAISSESGCGVDARHNREYTAREIEALLKDSGFDVTLLDTGPFRDEPNAEFDG